MSDKLFLRLDKDLEKLSEAIAGVYLAVDKAFEDAGMGEEELERLAASLEEQVASEQRKMRAAHHERAAQLRRRFRRY